MSALSSRILAPDSAPDPYEAQRSPRPGPAPSLPACPVRTVPLSFTRGTLIATKRGEVPVEKLTLSDRPITMDDGYQPIRWIGARSLNAAQLAQAPELRPIRIRQGALGTNLPVRDLVVAPHHRVLVRSRLTRRLFQTDELLMPAKALLVLHGVEPEEAPEGVEYWNLLFDRHQVIFSQGAPTGSLFVGPEALAAASAELRAQLLALCPGLADPSGGAASRPARPLIPMRRGLEMAGQLSMQNEPALDHRPWARRRR